LTVGPVSNAACGLRGIDAGVEFPFERAGGGVECDDFLRKRIGIERAVDNEWIVFKIAFSPVSKVQVTFSS
jgi:hypothetical protein